MSTEHKATHTHFFFCLSIAIIIHLIIANVWYADHRNVKLSAQTNKKSGIEVNIGSAAPYQAETPFSEENEIKSEADSKSKSKASDADTDITPKATPIFKMPNKLVVPEKPKTSKPSPKKKMATTQTKNTKQSESKQNQQTHPQVVSTPSRNSMYSQGHQKAQQTYYMKLAAWLAKHKRYPRRAKKTGITGVVKIRFSINTSGQINEFTIVESSGHKILDKAALDMLKRASPLPKIPQNLNVKTLTLTVPIQFTLTQ